MNNMFCAATQGEKIKFLHLGGKKYSSSRLQAAVAPKCGLPLQGCAPVGHE